LAGEGKELKSETESLDKKLHYLETTYKNSRDGIERLLASAGPGAR
jgi:prefoldin subunit 1